MNNDFVRVMLFLGLILLGAGLVSMRFLAWLIEITV